MAASPEAAANEASDGPLAVAPFVVRVPDRR